jgi:cytochrome P450
LRRYPCSAQLRNHLCGKAFGHHCLGVHLARLGLRVAIGEWLTAIPAFEAEQGFTPSLVAWEAERLATLPLRWRQ